jgi:DNA-binding transcriptional LysR family regulator
MPHGVHVSETLPADLLDLRAFCLVVDLGSVTGAAKTLGETKSSVSRRLTRLESSLGVTLVRRSTRLVQPTEEGSRYRLRVGRALELLEDATSELQEAHAAPRGLLRITAPQDLATLVIAPHLARFSERFPEVKVELLLTEKALDFDAHQLDIALRASGALRDSSLIAHKLMELEMAFVASPAYLAQHRAPRGPDELEHHRMLLMMAPGGHLTVNLIRPGEEKASASVRLRPDVLARDGAFLRQVALAGGGIANLPDVLVQQDLAEKRLVRVLPGYRVDLNARLYLLHPAMHFIPPKVRAFRDFMLQALSPGPASPAGS